MKRLAVLAVLVAALFAPTVAHTAVPVVYVGNHSTSVTQAQIDAALPAFQTMVSRDLQRYWGVDAQLTTDPAAEATASMVIYVEENSDQPGALGYHGVSGGRPYGKVFAADCAFYQDDWRLVFTHELEEMLVDPWITRFQTGAKGRMWLVEVSDPVESGYFAYWIAGVPISDFVTPFWYGAARRRRVDFMGYLTKPGEVGRHGYASFKTPSGSWQQIFG